MSNKTYNYEDFYGFLTEEFQKTSEVAKKVGCSRSTATAKLLLLLEAVTDEAAVNGTQVTVEMKWIPNDRTGARTWRRVPAPTTKKVNKMCDPCP